MAERLAVKKQLRELQLAKNGFATTYLGTSTEELKAELAKLGDETPEPAPETVRTPKPEKSKKKAK